MRADELKAIFERQFVTPPKIFSAPGRVNLIGEHTDYNDGFVLPSAIGFYAYVAVVPRPDRKLVLRSSEFPQQYEIDLERETVRKRGEWCDYVLGVVRQLMERDVQVPGANVLVHGEVPMGAGLSSSAALEVASAVAFLDISGAQMTMKDVARLCQRAENEFVGAHVGIMDQFVSCHGREGNAVRLDCRSLEFELVPISSSVKFVICNTMVKHELSGGEYNVRRQQCEDGVRTLAQAYPGVKALRDVSLERLQARRDAMPEVIYKRCQHVIEENARVLEMVKQLRAGNLKTAGELMAKSHASLRDLYEVSCEELDMMVEAAQGLPGFIGGRMTGGGFGGCTVNLVEEKQAEKFAETVAERYRSKTGILPDVFVCSAADGAGYEAARVQAQDRRV